MDHSGRNVKARRARKGWGKDKRQAEEIPGWEEEGSSIADAGTWWVCGLSCASPKGWAQMWGVFSPCNTKSAGGTLLRVAGQGLLQQEWQSSGKGWGKVTNGTGPWQLSLPEDPDWDGLILLLQILGLGRAWGTEGRSGSLSAGLHRHSWPRGIGWCWSGLNALRATWWGEFPTPTSTDSTDICPLFSFLLYLSQHISKETPKIRGNILVAMPGFISLNI